MRYHHLIGGVCVPVRQLTTEELKGIWSEVADLSPLDSPEEFRALGPNSLELTASDPRGPAHGCLLLMPWKDRSDVYQIFTPRRKAPSHQLIEYSVELSDRMGWGILTPLTGSWNLRPYRRLGFRRVQRILSFLKADYVLPPPIEWVGVDRLSRCATAEELRRLDEQCFVPFWQLSPSEIGRTLDTELALGLRTHNELIGYASAVSYGRQGSIGRLAVHPDYRRQGIGSGLLRGMIQLLHQHGIAEVGVTTQAENLPARNLYQAFGFFFTAELEILGYPHPPEADIWGL